ncbi:phospholipase D-like domain-containing protein [Sulfuricurvum sp.]|uniref:phospholipase D-like domain-containing protein n=1 Tax=Sulfuricurvum sp. TaxID=2025608 RepID=UPI002D2EFFA2|nr:phospholipase D-like domain-containing protein [Sulfuricurvum sp.]HZF71024.1 phospholipase D-like domain-containing protein [Sulfuricurvum sp.]
MVPELSGRYNQTQKETGGREMGYISLYIVFIAFAQTVTMLHMLYLRRNHSTILAWFMVILMFPFPAFILYFIFGNRKVRQKSKKSTLVLHKLHQPDTAALNPIETVLASHEIAGTTVCNDIQLYFDGVDAYNALLHEIRNAKESIWISTYILHNDSTAKVILEALTQKASEGLDVRILIDAVGSYGLYIWQRPLREFKNAGGKAVFFMPILEHPLRNYINLRNHRKIFLFDERVALAGGMNLGKRYMGSKPEKKRWIDMIFRLEGDAVFPYSEIFLADFTYASGEMKTAVKRVIACSERNAIQVVPSGPDMSSDALYEALLSAIHSAHRRVWIVTPYFVPDETILRALIIAKHKGVDVKLIAPYTSDHWITDIGRSSYMREAEENGLEVLLYQGNMLHTKAVLLDDYAVMLGSVNIDNRSLFLNYEVVSFVYSKPVIVQMDEWVNTLITHSLSGMTKGSKKRVILENFMRIFSPQL